MNGIRRRLDLKFKYDTPYNTLASISHTGLNNTFEWPDPFFFGSLCTAWTRYESDSTPLGRELWMGWRTAGYTISDLTNHICAVPAVLSDDRATRDHSDAPCAWSIQPRGDWMVALRAFTGPDTLLPYGVFPHAAIISFLDTGCRDLDCEREDASPSHICLLYAIWYLPYNTFPWKNGSFEKRKASVQGPWVSGGATSFTFPN
jgi:hypothetical protein